MALIYMARSRITGERYIGLTVRSVAKRRTEWRFHARAGRNHPFCRALRDRGEQSFEWTILRDDLSLEDAREQERQLILEYRPTLNLIHGGGGRSYYLRGERKASPKVPRVRRPTASLTGEEWRPIPGYEDFYEASSMGRIRSHDRFTRGRWGAERFKRGRVLKQRIDPKTLRHRVYLSVENVRREFKVASLVALTFIGPRPPGLEVCHWSDDKSDNSIANLCYGTHLENCDDRSRNGRSMRGEKATGVILNEDQVRDIKRQLLIPGKVFHRELASQYGVTREAISRISQGKNWSHVRI